MINFNIDNILSRYQDVDDFLALDEFKLGGDKKNEMIMFLKPEVFLGKTDAQIKKILEMVFAKMEEFGVEVGGAALIPGEVLSRNRIMDRHYGYINTVSRKASTVADDDLRREMMEKLNLDLETDYPVLGGHEFMEKHDLDPETLDKLWLEQPSTKIKSGFYARPMNYLNNNYILVNGFHPYQLAHYTNKDRRLMVMLVKSDTNWANLRDDMVGNTFPEKANLGSIRRNAYERAIELGFGTVSIANNVVHLSAGPAEAVIEIDNFFRPTIGLDITSHQPRLINRLVSEGLPLSDVMEILDNPFIDLADIKGDFNGLTEHKDLEEAVELWRKYKNYKQK